MKVVFLAGSGELGGAERSLIDVVAGLRSSYPDWDIVVVLPAFGPLERELGAIPARVMVVEQPATLSRLGDAAQNARIGRGWRRLATVASDYARALPGVARYARRLHRELRTLAPDIVHTNGFKQHVVGAWIAPRRAAVVWHVRDFVSSRPVMRRLLRVARGRCAVIIANSDAVANDVLEMLPASRVVRIYNGIDMSRFQPSGPKLDIDAAAGWELGSDDIVRVGLVATFARWKGHEVFIRAVASLPSCLHMRAYIIGGAIYATEGSQYATEELRDIAARYGLGSDRLGFTGHVDEPASAIRALDIVVHASTQPEPFGRVIAEAMACRRAVLVADSGGASELIADVPQAGYRAGDWQVLAQRLEVLIGDATARQTLADRGYSVARQRFDRRRIVSELAPIYEGITGRGSNAHDTRRIG